MREIQYRNVVKGCLIAKTDIESAFGIVPVRRKDPELLEPQSDTCLKFGKWLPICFDSCCTNFDFSFFEALILEWIGRFKGHIQPIVHVLDNLLFIGPSEREICNQFASCRLMCESLVSFFKEKNT